MATPIVKDSAAQKLAVCLLRLPREKGLAAEAPTKMKLLAMGEVVPLHFLLCDRLP
jgi:hypothetical protein